MHPKSSKLLADISDAATFIQTVCKGKTLQDFQADRLLRHAVERNFEIIGEAMNRLTRLDPETAGRIGHTDKIVAFRNVLIHGYDLVDRALVWKVVTDHLPVLGTQVAVILEGG